MAEDLIPDWRVQASFKFGPGDRNGVGIHMLNVRADDFAELSDLLEAVPTSLAGKLASASAALGVAETVSQATGAPVDVVSHGDGPPAGHPATVPHCAHGPRTYYDGGKWEAYFCPQPKNAKNKCDAIFKGDDNKDEPYWP